MISKYEFRNYHFWSSQQRILKNYLYDFSLWKSNIFLIKNSLKPSKDKLVDNINHIGIKHFGLVDALDRRTDIFIMKCFLGYVKSCITSWLIHYLYSNIFYHQIDIDICTLKGFQYFNRLMVCEAIYHYNWVDISNLPASLNNLTLLLSLLEI